jgi:hypothetical protein
MTHEIQIAHSTYLSTQIKKRISVGGIDVDEDFVKELLIKHLRQGDANDRPTLSDGGSEKRCFVRLEFQISVKSKLRISLHRLGRPKRVSDSSAAFRQFV